MTALLEAPVDEGLSPFVCSLVQLDEAIDADLARAPADADVYDVVGTLDGHEDAGQVAHMTFSPYAWRFLTSDKDVCVLYGARRDGKTVSGVARLIYNAQRYPEACPIQVAVVRDTWMNLQRTTIKTLKEGSARGWWDAQFLRSDTECILNGGACHLYFFGMDRPADANKFQGFEAGIVWIEEPAPAADLASGVPADVFALGLTSMSQRGLKPSVQITMNPPDEDHWTVHLIDTLAELGSKDMEVEAIWIPPGANKHVSQGYRRKMRVGLEAIGRHDLVRRLVEGQIGSVQLGLPVAPAFNDKAHVAREPIEIKSAFQTWRSFDAGHNPTCVWAQVTPQGQLNVVGVVVGMNMGMKELIQQHVIPWEQEYLPRPRTSMRLSRGAVRGAVIRTTGDPNCAKRGEDSTEHAAKKMIEGLLHTDFEPGPPDWPARRESLHAALNEMVGGRPKVLIDPECYPLIKALRPGGWRYHVTPSGKPSPLPIKDIHSHPGDAFATLLAKLWPAHETLRKLLRDEPERVARPQPVSFMGV